MVHRRSISAEVFGESPASSVHAKVARVLVDGEFWLQRLGSHHRSAEGPTSCEWCSGSALAFVVLEVGPKGN
jgi:hypothetical protein